MLHPLPKNVFSLRLVPTLAITTQAQKCWSSSRNACRRQARQNGEEPKDARRGYAIAIAIMGRTQPGFFRLLAIGELVGDKHCAIRTSIFALEW